MVKKENLFNRIRVNEKYKACKDILEEFDKSSISYAVVKGAVLSKKAYGDSYYRKSGDIDILIRKEDAEQVKCIIHTNGFIQGCTAENGIEPFSREEIIFQSSVSHQIAPFVKKIDNYICEYINLDVNVDVMWGESKEKADMTYVLSHTAHTSLCNVAFRKLTTEMEFVHLCLHHYKDMNSIYLLSSKSLKLCLFCDIYYYIKNNLLNITVLKEICAHLNVAKYIYYCLYYTHLVFDDQYTNEILILFDNLSYTKSLESFGLSDYERRSWTIDFWERLISINIEEYLNNVLSEKDLQKIQINRQYM